MNTLRGPSIRRPKAGGLDPDAINYIDALTANGMNDALSNSLYGFDYSTLQQHINDVFVGLKDFSLVVKIQILYLYVGDTKALQGIEVITPGTNDATFFNTVPGDHTATGWQGNGANSYADTGFSSGLVTGADSHQMTYTRTPAAANTCALGVEGGASDFFLFPQLASGDLQYRIDAVNVIDPIADGSGMIIGTSRAPNDHETYRNTATVGTSSAAIGALPVGDIYLGARNDITGGGPISNSAREFIAHSVGKGLTDTDVTNYTSVINTFQTALGRNTF